MSELWLAALTAIVSAICILAPFVFGKGGRLQATSSISDSQQLESMKTALLKRFLVDERAFQVKEIGAIAWEQRRNFLVNRYIDTSHRLDFLNALNKQGNESHHDQ